MAYLVTGAAGFIGSHTVDLLLREGAEVIGLDNFDPFYDPAIKERNLQRARAFHSFTEVRGDIRDRSTLEALPRNIDTVIHLAARAGVRPSVQDPALCSSVNVGGTVEILEWMRSREIPRLVFASSSSVYGNNTKVPFSEFDPVERPISPYAASKRAGELLCYSHHHLFGISMAALRFFTVYGPRQRVDLAIHKFALLLDSGRPVTLYGDGTSERDYTYIDDILVGLRGALDLVHGPVPSFEVINLGGARTIALREMVAILAEEMGVIPRLEWHPAQPGDVTRTYADIAKARRLLGYEPTTDFRTGVMRFLEWFEGNNQAAHPAGRIADAAYLELNQMSPSPD